MVPAGQLHLRVYLLDCFLQPCYPGRGRAAYLIATYRWFPSRCDFKAAVLFFDLAKLRQRDTFARGRDQANLLNGLLRRAVLQGGNA